MSQSTTPCRHQILPAFSMPVADGMSDVPGLASTYLPRQWGFSEPRKLSMVSKGDRNKKKFSPELRLFLEELGEIVKESLAERHRRQGTMRETKRQKEGEEDESGGILPGQ